MVQVFWWIFAAAILAIGAYGVAYGAKLIFRAPKEALRVSRAAPAAAPALEPVVSSASAPPSPPEPEEERTSPFSQSKATSQLALLKAATDQHLALLRFLGTSFPFDDAKLEMYRTMHAKCINLLVPSSLTRSLLTDAPRRSPISDGLRMLNGYEQLRLSLFNDLARQTKLAVLNASAVDLLLEVQDEIIALRSRFYPDGP
jgi:hypothetical protein